MFEIDIFEQNFAILKVKEIEKGILERLKYFEYTRTNSITVTTCMLHIRLVNNSVYVPLVLINKFVEFNEFKNTIDYYYG